MLVITITIIMSLVIALGFILVKPKTVDKVLPDDFLIENSVKYISEKDRAEIMDLFKKIPIDKRDDYVAIKMWGIRDEGRHSWILEDENSYYPRHTSENGKYKSVSVKELSNITWTTLRK